MSGPADVQVGVGGGGRPREFVSRIYVKMSQFGHLVREGHADVTDETIIRVYMRNFNPGRVQPGLKVCTIDKRGERLHEDS